MRDNKGQDIQPPRAGIRGVVLIFATGQHHKVVRWDGNTSVLYISKNTIEKISCYTFASKALLMSIYIFKINAEVNIQSKKVNE